MLYLDRIRNINSMLALTDWYQTSIKIAKAETFIKKIRFNFEEYLSTCKNCISKTTTAYYFLLPTPSDLYIRVYNELFSVSY